MTLEQIQETIGAPWQEYRQRYRQEMRSPIALLQEVNDYHYHSTSKQLRPLLVLLSAGAVGRPTQVTTVVAVAIELLHNASLLHDDVVDDDDERRGKASVRSRWGNHIALLTGDYYLALIMSLLEELHDGHYAQRLAHTVLEMTEGEMMQQQMRDHIDLDGYREIVRRKTASLMSACCALGAYSSGCQDTDVRCDMESFGMHFGMAFQMRDDLHDSEHDDAPWKNMEKEIAAERDNEIKQAITILNLLKSSPYKTCLQELTKILTT